MRLFVIISSFYALVFASELNYLQLNALRQQHNLVSDFRGQTQMFINSSKRFFDLYNISDEDDLEKLNQEVNNAFKSPYKTHISLDQVIVYKSFLIKINIQNSLIAEINNPVFPEAEVFNSRTDGLWVQNDFDYKDVKLKTNISYLNRWYIDETYSLKDIITDDIELEMQNSKTYTPLMLDLYFSKTNSSEEYKLNFIGFDLTNSDRYDYFFTEIQYNLIYQRAKYGISFEPYYIGDYLLEDSLSLLFHYKFNKNLFLSTKLSQINKNILLSFNHEHFNLQTGYEMIHRTAISHDYIENFYLRLSLLY
jgi:hypothetical protein